MNNLKFAKLGVVAVSAMLFAACSGDDKNGTGAKSDENISKEELIQTRDSLKQVIADQDSLLSLINDLGNGMAQIKNLENILSVDVNSETPDRREQIKRDMADIQRELDNRRQRLNELEARLNKSNSNNANLKKVIVSLKGQIAEQTSTIESLRKDLKDANIYIEELTEHVDSLSTTVENTLEEKHQVERENTELANQLNTCYYVVGSKSELKTQKIIETGFLKKTKIMPDDFQKGYFTTADQRTLRTIALHSKKAKVLTQQPAHSYTITEDANGMKVLNITNPQEFWSTYKYLVVQID